MKAEVVPILFLVAWGVWGWIAAGVHRELHVVGLSVVTLKTFALKVVVLILKRRLLIRGRFVLHSDSHNCPWICD